MPEQWLACLVCGAQFDLGPLFAGCPQCARQNRKAALEVRYEYQKVDLLSANLTAPGIWRWRALLPRVSEENAVSLHEGGTPLVKLAGWNVPGSLYLKNETVNPTWSYKDRANCISISLARQFGFQNIATMSTGNHGSAAAAYSSAGHLQCVVFCHEDAPDLQLALMSFYGAKVLRGGQRDEMLLGLVSRGGWFPSSIICPRRGCSNPYGVEGFKTIAFEIFHQLGNRAPERVFVPVGSGDGLYGIYKGFVELQRLGLTERIPRMYACQASGANPYVRAFRARAPRLVPVDSANTIALSIAEKIGGEPALRALYESEGEALDVDDEAILSAQRALARQGFALEPASATALACAQKLASQSAEPESWVVIGTGTAVRWPDSLRRDFSMPDKLPFDFLVTSI